MWTLEQYDRARSCAMEIANTLDGFLRAMAYDLDSSAGGGRLSGVDLCQLRLKSVRVLVDRWIDDNPLDANAFYPLAVLLVELSETIQCGHLATIRAVRRELYDSMVYFLDYVDRLTYRNCPPEYYIIPPS